MKWKTKNGLEEKKTKYKEEKKIPRKMRTGRVKRFTNLILDPPMTQAMFWSNSPPPSERRGIFERIGWRMDVLVYRYTLVRQYVPNQTSFQFEGTRCVFVLHIKPFLLPVDMQHTQCPCRFFLLWIEIQALWSQNHNSPQGNILNLLDYTYVHSRYVCTR